jgi:hypothetical protein
MVKRSTWVMVVLLAILAGLAYYSQQPDNLIKKTLESAGGTPTAEPLGLLLPPTAGPLKGVSIQDADGKSVALERKNTGWTMRIGAGSESPADQGAAEQAASQALGVRLVVKIESTSNLSAFGLDKPAYTCKLVLADGKPVTFKIGNATVTGDGYYLQKEDGSVFVVDKYGLDALLNLLVQPPYMFTPTPPVIETPTPTATTG